MRKRLGATGHLRSDAAEQSDPLRSAKARWLLMNLASNTPIRTLDTFFFVSSW
jgi:hypothetical protein